MAAILVMLKNVYNFMFLAVNSQRNFSIPSQGRLSLSTDGDKCAMVNLGGGMKNQFWEGMKKFIIKSVNFVHKFSN